MRRQQQQRIGPGVKYVAASMVSYVNHRMPHWEIYQHIGGTFVPPS